MLSSTLISQFYLLFSFWSSILITDVHSSPTPFSRITSGLNHRARAILSRSTPAAPHWVVYGGYPAQGTTGPPAPSNLKGFNVYLISFLRLDGTWGGATQWTKLTAAQRSTIKTQYHNAGVKLMVSAFGDANTPTTSKADPVATANSMAAWVKKYSLDGIDVDYEDFAAFNAGNGKAEQWLISYTQQLRKQLPMGQYLITHAPVAPWFAPNKWGGGGYLKVHKAVGSLIDWYNVQFYNQGTNEYTTCNGLLHNSTSHWPNSSLFQIAANGVPKSKLVIGKPAIAADANNGYLAPATLASCLQQAKGSGWNGGVMAWVFPDATPTWISTVRKSSWPV